MEEERKVLFINVSALTKEESKILMKQTMLRSVILSCVLIPVLLAGLGAMWWFWLNDKTMGIVMFVFAAIFAVIYPILFWRQTAMAGNSVTKYGKILNRFEFTEDMIYASSERMVNEQSQEYQPLGTINHRYSDINRMIVAEGFIYLFIDRQRVYSLNMQGMIEGKSEDLVAFLKTKIAKVKDKRKKKM